VREWGRADGPPIVFIHGWSQNHLCWDKQYESTLRDEFRLVAYDLRGHGMSEAPPGPGPYTDAGLWAEDLAAIIHFVDLTADDLPTNIRGMRSFLRACVAKPVAAEDFETALCWNMAVAPQVRASLAAREIDGDDVLADLRVPLLVTQGRSDTVVLPAMAEHILATCPAAETSWYDGVGHVPHLEEPGRFNAELATLTRRVLG